MPIFEYPVQVEWHGGRDGGGTIVPQTSQAHLDINVPTEYGGAGGGTNPEELLTSAIAGCYSITFGIIAANRKFPVASVSVTAVGEVEQAGASFTYKKITIKPVITTDGPVEESVSQAILDVAHKADNYCIVTNAVRGKVEVVIEPSIA